MEILCCLVVAVNAVVVFLALRALCDGYSERGGTNDREIAGGVQHGNTKRNRRTRLNADVVADVLRFSSPHTIGACCLSSRQLNSIAKSLKNSRPLRPIDFVRIGQHSAWSSEVKMRCQTQARRRSSGKSFRDFALIAMRFALRNCYVQRLRIDDPQGKSFETLAAFAEEERCHVDQLEMNLMGIAASDYETVWRAIAALSPSRIHCAFDVFERRYGCLGTPSFMNAQRVVVEGPMRATERVLRFVNTHRGGSLCWLSYENDPADGYYLVEAIIETFQAQAEIGSFEHALFLQFPSWPSRWRSAAWCLAHHFGLAPSEDNIDFRDISRSYPGSNVPFNKHLVRCSDKYKAFVLENASGQRIFAVATSDGDASIRDDNYWLQRVAFVPELSILAA